MNKLPQIAKLAIIEALNSYGVDGSSEGGMAGFLYRCRDLVPYVMAGLAARLLPLQKDEVPEREDQVYRTPAEFDAALKAGGLPTLSHVLALQYDHSEDPDLRQTILDLEANKAP
jgi:hypothetical protein